MVTLYCGLITLLLTPSTSQIICQLGIQTIILTKYITTKMKSWLKPRLLFSFKYLENSYPIKIWIELILFSLLVYASLCCTAHCTLGLLISFWTALNVSINNLITKKKRFWQEWHKGWGISQWEASIQVTWSLSTNQRPGMTRGVRDQWLWITFGRARVAARAQGGILWWNAMNGKMHIATSGYKGLTIIKS